MKNIKKLYLFLLLLMAMNFCKAQSLIPQASSGQTIIQDVGLGKITLNYHRPNVKGRNVFGGLEPFGKVWRTGANNATTITFSEDVSIEGNNVPAGKYALFTIPDNENWTIILNKAPDQWGAYEYKETDDLVRFKVKSKTLSNSLETFTMQFSEVMDGKATLDLMWQKTLVSFNIVAEVESKVMSNIDNAMKGNKKPYFASALYYYNHDKDLNKALEWIEAAEKEDMKAPWIKLWKAKIQLKNKDKNGAKATAKEGIALAKASNDEEYARLNQELLDSIH